MRTPEDKLATKLRKAAEREDHRERVLRKHPPAIRYAKSKFKKGKKRQKVSRKKLELGVQ